MRAAGAVPPSPTAISKHLGAMAGWRSGADSTRTAAGGLLDFHQAQRYQLPSRASAEYARASCTSDTDTP